MKTKMANIASKKLWRLTMAKVNAIAAIRITTAFFAASWLGLICQLNGSLTLMNFHHPEAE